jgi:hypothetical protein
MARSFRHYLDTAKDEALTACDFTNSRGRQPSLEPFVVHMSSAWLALFQAMNVRDDIDMRYHDSNGKIEKVDGEPRTWDLATCLARRFPDPANPVRVNLEFFLRLHAKIEHRYGRKAHVALETLLAGKVQANIRNFEQTLTAQFGSRASLANDLRFPVFLSSLAPDAAENLRAARAKAPRALVTFIETFDDRLAPEVSQSDRYEFRVLLFEKTGPRGDDGLAVEFLSPNDLSPEQRKAMDNAMVLVRDKQVPVVNLERLKPGQVVERVREVVPAFNLTYHTYAYRKFKARPRGKAPDPTATNPAYCIYDAAHRDYVYTQAWVLKLLHELEHNPAAVLAEWKREALGK